LFSDIRSLALRIFSRRVIGNIRYLAFSPHVKVVIALRGVSGVGSVSMLVISITIKLGELGGLRENERVAVE
jgi:hypothetical protein